MSQLGPGWVDQIAKDTKKREGGISEEPALWAYLRAKGQTVWKRNDAKYRESCARGGRKGPKNRKAMREAKGG